MIQKCPFASMQHCNRSIPKARTLLNICGLIVAHAANNSLLHFIFRWLRENLNVEKKCHEDNEDNVLATVNGNPQIVRIITRYMW